MSSDSLEWYKSKFEWATYERWLCLYPSQVSQKLVVKIFEVSRGLSPEIVNESFQFREQIPYNLKQIYLFQIALVHSVFNGRESPLGAKIWIMVPNEMKQSENLGKLRKVIK